MNMVAVIRFKDKGIYVGPASHCYDFTKLYILGSTPGRGIGLNLDRCKVSGRAIKIHFCKEGLVANSCHDLNFSGLAFEHCSVPLRIGNGTTNCEFHAEMQTCSKVPIDLTGCDGGVTIKARIRKVYGSDNIFYKNPEGKEVPLAWNKRYPKGDKGKTVRIETKN